jgi:hypothetical protein
VIPGAEAPSHPLFIIGSSYCPIRRVTDEELEGGKDVMMVDNESVMVVAVAVVLTL